VEDGIQLCCPNCGFDNPGSMNCCGRCGTKLRHRCPQCGFENPPGFAFCGKCGRPLTGQTPAPGPPRRGWREPSRQHRQPRPDRQRPSSEHLTPNAATSRLAQGLFECRDLASYTVKGVSTSVPPSLAMPTPRRAWLAGRHSCRSRNNRTGPHSGMSTDCLVEAVAEKIQ
jgi:Double zinc ribbon